MDHMEGEKIYTPETLSKIIVYGVWGSLFCIFGYAYFFLSGPLIAAVISGMALILSVLWMRGLSISTSYDGITVGSGFGRYSSLSWSDVQEVTTQTKVYSTGKTVSAKYETTLRSNTPSKKDLRINIKLYSRRDLKEFASTLLQSAKGASIDGATKAMSEGRMPSAFGFGK